MQSTASPVILTTLQATLTAQSRTARPAAANLVAAFAQVPDPRHRRGTRIPLPALLTLAVLAVLSNHLSVLAIAEWGEDHTPDTLRRLGLAAGVAPHQST